MSKPENRMSVREEKAAALDDFVKAELARLKAVNDAKVAKLRALRLARDAADAAHAAVSAPSAKRKSASGKTLHLPRRS